MNEEGQSTLGESSEDLSPPRARNPWLAALLALLEPAVGYFYVGRWKRGVFVPLGALICLYVLLGIVRLHFSFFGLVTIITLGIFYRIAILFDTIRIAKSWTLEHLESYQRWHYYVLVWIVSLVVLQVNSYGLRRAGSFLAFRIPAGSMEETLLVGDYILVDCGKYDKQEPKEGDLVVFRFPRQPDLSYVKRCVAVGGQMVEIRDRGLFVDSVLSKSPSTVKFTSQKLLPKGARERNIFSPDGESWNRDHFGPIAVPKENYFVLGDNRDNSADSRYWGFLPRKYVLGKPLYIYFSKNKRTHAVRWDRLGKTVE
ncbi:MAG: signal peptidase I [bacterium]